MKKQLLDWWKGTFEKSKLTRYRKNKFDYVIDIDDAGYWYWDFIGIDPKDYYTLREAYEASLIHYLEQNKGLLEIVFYQGALADMDWDTFESWFKEVTE